MLDAFEARLADLFADRLAGTPGLRPPVRRLPEAPVEAGILPVLRVLSASAAPLLGDDAPLVRRLPGGLGLRTVLALEGAVGMELIPAADVARPALLQALDAVLVAFQATELRSGGGFADGTDQGFALHGFRFRDVAAPEDGAPPLRHRLRLNFTFQGEFWPVRPEAEGPAITAIPARLVSLPVQVAQGLVARAGGPELIIPLTLDMRSLGAGPARVVARLRGAAPPGTLQGDAAEAPPGFISVPVDAAGVARLVFRPAATVAAPVLATIQVALAGAGQAGVALAEIPLRVLP
jgi:hypothetical protein